MMSLLIVTIVVNNTYNDDILQIGFGFCKGDDNFGGGRRKALDDYTKVTCCHISLMFELRLIDDLVVVISEIIASQIVEKNSRAWTRR